ncbi:MAG: hypothetical protein R2932_38170 [Caldilineaceae bacterium]
MIEHRLSHYLLLILLLISTACSRSVTVSLSAPSTSLAVTSPVATATSDPSTTPIAQSPMAVPAATAKPTAAAQIVQQSIDMMAQERSPTGLFAHVTVVLDGLVGPVGLAALPDGTLLIAEEGTGANDECRRDDAHAGGSKWTTDYRSPQQP